MYKNLTWKIALVILLVAVASLTLYPPHKTLKPGIDLAGGTSLIYEIDSQGLSSADKKDLSQKMITILRRRIDPANIQNLVWRPQGNTRFEIQMPLASAEARQKRLNCEEKLTDLLSENINIATIMRSLKKPADIRSTDFEKLTQNFPARKEILDGLANAYDEQKELEEKRDKLNRTLQAKEWSEAVEKLTNPETGKIVQYKQAQRNLDKLNISQEQINSILDLPLKSLLRNQKIERLKSDFPDKIDEINAVISAYDEYHPFRGGLDDPKDLKRMLKGTGILEFRILPTQGHAEVDMDEMSRYVELLKSKGPKYASDNKYVWCEIENYKEWKSTNSIVAAFGDKYYVLASNKTDEVVLHYTGKKDWKLKSASPQQDNMGRRAIGFILDEKGGKIFSKITGKNMERPLCILLDGIAISAPNISAKIYSHGIITGTFTQTEVMDMVNKLNAGSLPARLIEQPLSEKTIGPSIGVDNRDKGIKSGFIGFAIVALFMLIYYLKSGLIADIALFINLLFILAVMALLRANFTMPGIAGIILTIGMSVDANVLIFERIREEQQKGSSLAIAIKNGYQKAFGTILDSNLTTFITATILFWVASEEIKGFAIVLMLGIISSMFTALFVTRVNFNILLANKLIKKHLFMMTLIRKPNINWMKLRPVFITISSLLIASGLFVFFTRDNVKNNKYDIEFTGGTSVQIDLKEDVNFSRQDVEDKIHKTGILLNNPAIAAANVYSIEKTGKQYEINTTETNKVSTTIKFAADEPQTIEAIKQKLEENLNNLIVTAVNNPFEFIITTSQSNKSVIKTVISSAYPKAEITEPETDEIVNKAILQAFAGHLKIQQNLSPTIVSMEKITEELINSYPEFVDFLGGVKINCQIKKSATLAEIDRRIKDLKFKPDMQNLNWYTYKILSSDLTELGKDESVVSFVYLSVEPEAGYRQLTEDEWTQFTNNEKSKIISAATLETSLPRVTQINPSIGAEAKTRALIAIVLSLFVIIFYIWVRFGDVRYGLAAIIALIHDVCIILGAVTACTYIANTSLGKILLIGDFKIDLAMIAAFLTIIGYSLNDTIVIFDRIRENRQKKQLTATTINNSINQTLSRTILTSFTTFIVVLIMYIFGGQGMKGFAFAIGLGVIVGTYSSIAIAAPILMVGTKLKEIEGK